MGKVTVTFLGRLEYDSGMGRKVWGGKEVDLTRIVLRFGADEGEIYAEGAFDSNIGKTIPVQGTPGVIKAAEVVEDGKAVLLTIEV